MNDSHNAKELVISTIGATQLPGAARTFSRVQPKKVTESLRRSTHISSLSPTDIRIAHTPASKVGDVSRSLLAVDQMLQRVDALSNPIAKDNLTVGLTLTKSTGCSLAEARTAFSVLFGALLENNGALIDAMFNQET